MIFNLFGRGRGPQLVDLGPEVFQSKEKDPELRLGDFQETYLSDTVEDIISDVLDREESLYAAYKAGKLSQGQWLLWVIPEFHYQVNNGGIAQFILNCENLVGEIPIALDILQMEQLARDYVKVVEPLIDTSSTNRDKAQDNLSSYLKAQRDDYMELVEQTENSDFDDKFYKGLADQLVERLVNYVASNPGEFRSYTTEIRSRARRSTRR